ncbi:MAG: Mrp/NBP35 family ATP-binding protein [Chloroflexota bacterium]
MTTKTEVMNALSKVMDPEIQRNVVELNMVRDLVVSDDGNVLFTLALTILACPLREQIAADARHVVGALPGVKNVEVTLGAMTDDERNAVLGIVPPQNKSHEIKRVIAVMSGKGGVGKSLVTGLLAAALKRTGYNVGILDADVTGASIPKLFGIHGPLVAMNNKIQPIQSRTGIKIISVNLTLVDENQAFVWRGAMITNVIQQFWNDVDWGKLDYLLVDMPPGTSDAALTVMQDLPINGILMVTTPQALATMIVKKAIDMAQKVNVPILGIIENMAGFIAPDTGIHYEIFGPSHAHEVAEQAGASLLARLSIDPLIAQHCDAGEIELVTLDEMTSCVEALVLKQPVTV